MLLQELRRGSDNGTVSSMLERHAALIVAALAMMAALTSLPNGFAYDDVLVIVRDDRLHHVGDAWRVFGQSYWMPEYGGSLYRPLTSLGFALQWAVGGGSPLIFHVISLLLYGAVTVAVYLITRDLFNSRTAFVASSIFAVHPVHVEVVANIVGQAELASALLMILCLRFYLKSVRAAAVSGARIAAICAMYGAALMFKESAVILPALLLAVDMHAVRAEPMKRRLERGRLLALSIIVTSLAFVAVRTFVLGSMRGAGQPSDVFDGLSLSERAFTALALAPKWMALFLWPANLSADYSSPAIRAASGFDVSMIAPLAFIAGLAGIAIVSRKRAEGTTFAIVWFAIAMVIPSNVIVVTGVTFAERLLFLPSVGVAMLLGHGIVSLARLASYPFRRVILAAVVCLVVAGVVRSSYRNMVWRDNETLFRQTILDAPESWRAHMLLGEMLLSQGKEEAIEEMTLGARLSPKNDLRIRYLTAAQFHGARFYDAAIPFYQESIALAPANPFIRASAARCLLASGRLAEARGIVLDGLTLTPGHQALEAVLRSVDSTAVARGSHSASAAELLVKHGG